jgi:hypothetical protein
MSGSVPRLCEFYPGICLTTEEKAWKNLSHGNPHGIDLCTGGALAHPAACAVGTGQSLLWDEADLLLRSTAGVKRIHGTIPIFPIRHNCVRRGNFTLYII